MYSLGFTVNYGHTQCKKRLVAIVVTYNRLMSIDEVKILTVKYIIIYIDSFLLL